PPQTAMTAPGARVASAGSLYRIDQTGTGRVTVYRLVDGSYALRLDDFFVAANIDLELRFSPLDAPHTTGEYTSSPHSDVVAPLDITAGSLNFAVPKAIDPTQYRSVVIWCPLIQSAYAAATLSPAR
ncbi:MAG: DM13 domain-containing protein, partial [Actinomycetota bacterium]|nr:DM13 domain-containing protein [Actinomycetota bacterium]